MMGAGPGAGQPGRPGAGPAGDCDMGMMEGKPGWMGHPGPGPGLPHGARGGDWGGMTGPGMMGPGMTRMMVILMDTNGDGALSLDEVQAVHARIFAAMDTDGDGKLTSEEMEAFMHPDAQ
ncbi:EF-hand domain-containing protein [Amaricoccus solimangrovi]|uniref:EF-hand domain-containing protein n=2 Tax=Amaricoccus solimangrovi TaxID=2589815 RepID=A0A501WSS8_9RHOB|nr:EF-hand domain-containing protein [Amaricoccus solimangrovi]